LLSYTEVAKFTKEEFQQYLKEMHFEWDTYAEELYTKTRIEEGIKKGIEQGLQQGIEQGLQQGIEKGIQQGIEKGIQQGIEKGIEQGIEQGFQQGIEQNKREMAKGLRDAGVAISIISQQSGLSEDEIKSL
jgi:flagellar biosynthesis/type III secretory pathway protein FliH